MICPRSHSSEEAEPRFKLRILSGLRGLVLSYQAVLHMVELWFEGEETTFSG